MESKDGGIGSAWDLEEGGQEAERQADVVWGRCCPLRMGTGSARGSEQGGLEEGGQEVERQADVVQGWCYPLRTGTGSAQGSKQGGQEAEW